MRSRTVLATALAGVIAASLVGCTDIGAPMPTPTPSPTYAVTGDGVLRIGTLFATTGGYGAAQVAGVETAVREINEAGGVNGVPVEVFHRNSGDVTTETAEAAYAELVAKGVDVVIGPTSSAIAERLVAPVIAAGVPLISPSAISATLTTLADEGLVFRTISGYAAQGPVLAAAMADARVATVAYVYLDDENGAALLDSLTAAGEEAGLAIAFSGSFPAATTNFASLVSKVKKAKPDAVVIATPGDALEQTTALITALDAASLGGSTLWLTSQNTADYSAALPAGALDQATGIYEGALPDAAFAARLKQADPGLGTLRYAAEAYDATILAALAAVRAGDDGGPAIARLLPVVSAKGIPCTSFGACLDVLSTEPDFDYDGVSGPVDMTSDGDLTSGAWNITIYAAENTFTLDRSVIAG